ncbi:MAG: hypothetical protein IJ727_01865 [Treponema sp.]|nr:hypothetical protein [Treponema sp.]
MTKENKKETLRWLLLIFGFLFVSFTLLLYLGGACMKNCCVVKIICCIMLGLAFIGGIIAMCTCDTDDNCPPLCLCNKTTSCVCTYDSGFAIVRGNKDNYSFKHFDTLKSALAEIQDGDMLCIFDSELQLSEKKLKDLFPKQKKIANITIKFVNP